MTDISLVQTAITWLDGMEYTSFGKVILLCGVIPVVLALCWRAVARQVTAPESRALADMIVRGGGQVSPYLKLGFAQMNRWRKVAFRGGPEMERRRQRWAPYVALGGHIFGLVYSGVFMMVTGLGCVLFLHTREGAWFAVTFLFMGYFVLYGFYELAAASRARHTIKTSRGAPAS